MPTTFYNQPPYYDDFDQTKNYLRVLFRPGYAVQARELTQLQTSIQAQIDRFGSHVFKEGSPVLGGQLTVDTRYCYIKLESTFTYSSTTYYPEGNGSSTAYYQTAIGQTLTGLTTGVKAKVLEILPSTADDPLTAYVAYTQSSTDGTQHLFNVEEVLQFQDPNTLANRYFKVQTALQYPLGYGTRVSVNEGVYFIRGNFAYTPAESLIVSKYSPYPTLRVVYKITESIVTSAEDATLTDNAQGSPNEAAPGAHRYQIGLELVTQSAILDGRTETNIIQLLVLKSGKVTAQARTEYSELEKTLATRTYEESGNYTVRPFQINIREYYNDGTNGGLYTATEIQSIVPSLGTEAAAIEYGKERLAVGLEPSVAYVNGYRIETISTSYVTVKKARDEAYANLGSVLCPLGGYIYIDTLVGLPDITTYSPITLKNASNVSVGTARARGLEYVSGTIGTSAALYKLYLFDINITVGDLAAVRTLSDTTVVGTDFSATVNDPVSSITDTILYDSATSSLLYKLPYNSVQTLREIGGTIGFVYYVRRKFDGVVAGSTSIVLNATTNEYFDSTVASNYVLVKYDGTVYNPSLVTIGALGAQVTLSISGHSGASFMVIAPVRRNMQEKTKTLVADHSVTFASPNTTIGNYDNLSVCDLLRVKGVYMSADFNTAPNTSTDTNIIGRYDVDNGQRENFYDQARIRLKPGTSAPTGQITVVLDYFTHSTGDYFSVDSYSDIDYEDIPSFSSIKGSVELRDTIDFRPRKSTNGTTFDSSVGAEASTTNTPLPGSVILTDIQYYLPRTDKIYINKNGLFGVQYGISSNMPIAPENPEDSMILYVLALNSYTFDPTDLVATAIDNKRYTMRDIGRLEKRISNVEYYTSLSFLEKETASKQIFDSTGTMLRYKNGFVVDAFNDHNIGAIEHPDYRCAMDSEKQILRPQFYQDYVNLVPDLTQSSNIKRNGPIVTLNYTEIPVIEQPYSSTLEYVNPHAVYGWTGRIELSPPGDDWKETERKPDIAANADQQYDWFYKTNADAAAKTQWNSWSTQWYGANLPSSQTTGYTYTGANQSLPAQVSGTSTRTGSVSLSSGTYNLTTTVNFDDKVLDTTIIPYIRSRKIYFKATGLKPGSRMYAFFDGVSVDDFVRPETTFVDTIINPDNKNYLDYTAHPDGAAPLYANSEGIVIGSFVIPNTPTLKFRVGNRVFRLIDNSVNIVTAAFTYADVNYVAKGVIETRQSTVSTNTIVSTVEPVVIPSDEPVETPYNDSSSASTSFVPATQDNRPSASVAWNVFGSTYVGSSTNLIITLLGGSQDYLLVPGTYSQAIDQRFKPSGSTSYGPWSQVGYSESVSAIGYNRFTTPLDTSAPGTREYRLTINGFIYVQDSYEVGIDPIS